MTIKELKELIKDYPDDLTFIFEVPDRVLECGYDNSFSVNDVEYIKRTSVNQSILTIYFIED